MSIRNAYSSNNKKKDGPCYVIVRPAAALIDTQDDKPLNVADLCILQGDLYSSAQNIPRPNVAKAVVASLFCAEGDGFTVRDATFELCPNRRLYKNDEGNILDLLCFPTVNQKPVEAIDLPDDLIHEGATSYEDLLLGSRLYNDLEMNDLYGKRGTKRLNLVNTDPSMDGLLP